MLEEVSMNLLAELEASTGLHTINIGVHDPKK